MSSLLLDANKDKVAALSTMSRPTTSNSSNLTRPPRISLHYKYIYNISDILTECSPGIYAKTDMPSRFLPTSYERHLCGPMKNSRM